MDAEAFNPKLHPSYSPNLYRYLKHPTSAGLPMDVFRDQDGTLWIGRMNHEEGGRWFTGCRLARVLVSGATARRDVLEFAPSFASKLVKMLSFWEQYEIIGRCAIDTDHSIAYLNSDSRYVFKGNTRTCTWCNNRHRRHTWSEVVTHEKWVPMKAARTKANR